MANLNAYREASKMYPTLRECLDQLDEDGWFDERDMKKAKEIAKGLKQDNVPFNVIVKNTGITLQEVEAL